MFDAVLPNSAELMMHNVESTHRMQNLRTWRIATIAILIAVAPTLSAQARRPSSPKIPAAFSAIREADLRRDIGEMASPAMRGREGGTIDEMRASVWVAEQYRKIGLKPFGNDSSYYQWFDMTRTRVSVTA